MKNFLLLAIILLLGTTSAAYCATRTVTTYSNPNNYSYNSIYENDLSRMEEYIFGGNYRGEDVISRINRLEYKLFDKIYPNMNIAKRVNNLLSNYSQDNYYRNYLTGSDTNKSTAQRFLSRFVGQPTGFTPPIVNTPFNDYGYPMGINRSLYNNRGYRYNNVIPSTGAGIHILD